MAFNEEATLEPFVSGSKILLDSLGITYEVVIIDDASDDGTALIADKLAKELPGVRVIHHLTNRGLGGVYRTAFVSSQYDFLTFYPADGQFPADNLKNFLALTDSSDLILGNISEEKCSLLSRTLAAAERVILRLMFGNFPYFKGIIMFRRSILDKMQLKSRGRGWMILMELIIRAHRQGLRINTVSVRMQPRQHGKSKVNNLKTIFSFLKQIVSLRMSF